MSLEPAQGRKVGSGICLAEFGIFGSTMDWNSVDCLRLGPSFKLRRKFSSSHAIFPRTEKGADLKQLMQLDEEGWDT